MNETIDLPSGLAGFAFAFVEADQYKRIVLEISHGGTLVAQITAENYPTSFDVEWPSFSKASARPQCAKVDYDKLMEALVFGQRMLALRLVGTSTVA
jgi:hypothetical protein